MKEAEFERGHSPLETIEPVDFAASMPALHAVRPSLAGVPGLEHGPHLERPAELWHSFFALELTAVCREEQPAGRPFEHFLRTVGLGDDQSIELRYIVTPNPANWVSGKVEVYLIGCGRREEEGSSRQSAERLHESLGRALLGHLPEYPFAPVKAKEELERILQPFEVRCVADVVRREEARVTEDGELYRVSPLVGTGRGLDGLLKALLLRRAATIISICLCPASLEKPEKDYFGGGGMVSEDMEAGAHGLVTVPEQSQAQRFFRQNAVWRAEEAIHALGSSLEPAFAVKLQIGSADAMTEGEIEGLGTQLVGPACGLVGGADVQLALRAEERRAALSNLAFQGFRPWQESLAPEPLRRVRHLVGPAEAACVFRLPAGPAAESCGMRLSPLAICPPANLPTAGVRLGRSNYPGTRTAIRLGVDDRRRHVYCAGQTGTGKSTLLLNMIMEDIKSGEGVALIDPHGDLAQAVLERMPKERIKDVVLFDPADREYPVGLNMLETDTACPHQTDLVIQEMFSIFSTLFPREIIGPVFEHNMRNAMLLEMADPEQPGSLAGVPLCFIDQEYRKRKLRSLQDIFVRSFWEKQGVSYSERDKAETLGYFISKLGRFIEDGTMRNIVGQPKSAFDFREIMDEGRILIADLAVGRMGEISSSLLGCILIFKLRIAAMSRVNVREDKRRDFHLYVDEFQRFSANSFDVILSEARKYRLSLCVTNQCLSQLDSSVIQSILGNVGSLVCFRLGTADAKVLAEQVGGNITAEELTALPNWRVVVRLLNQGELTRPFTLSTLPPPQRGKRSIVDAVVAHTRRRYARSRPEVEQEIRSRMGVT